MTNANNFRWGIPPASNPPKCAKRGHLSTGMKPTLKIVPNISLEFPEYGITNAHNSFPANNPHRVRKGHLFNVM